MRPRAVRPSRPTVLVLAVVLGVVFTAMTGAAATTNPAATSTPVQCGEWQEIPSTLGRRDFATMVATAEHVVVWGGDRGTGNDVVLDGQVLTLATNEWSDITPRSNESSPTNIGALGGGQFVFTGYPSAVYSVSSRSWTPIVLAADKNPPRFVSTPYGLFALPIDRGSDPAVLLDARTGVERNRTAAPIDRRGYESSAHWVGSGPKARLVIMQANLPPYEPAQSASAQYDVRRDRWSRLPSMPFEFVAAALSATDGSRLFALGVTDARPDRLTLASWTPGEPRWKVFGSTAISTVGVEARWASRQFVSSQLLSVGPSLVVVTPDPNIIGLAVLHVIDKRGRTRSFPSPGAIGTDLAVAGNRLVALLPDGTVTTSCV